LEAVWAAWLAHALRVERLVLDATEVLAAHEIRSIVLKGVAFAHTVYSDAAMRVVGDVDVLIEPHNFTRAANALIADFGATRSLPELRAGFDDRFGKEILLRIHDIEFDLHRMFVEGPYGLAIDLADLWESPDTFALGGHELMALAPAARAVHAAYAAALGDWPLRLNAARDFAQTWVCDPTVLVDAADLARRWRCEAVIRAALERAREVFGAEFSERPLVLREHLSRRDRLFLGAYRGSGRGYLRNAVAPMAIGGVRRKMAFLAAVTLPDPEYLAARGTSRSSFIRHGWEKARPRRPAAQPPDAVGQTLSTVAPTSEPSSSASES
jgi:hypothetical protein